MPDGHETALSPEQAVDRLEALHAEAVRAQREALARFAAGGAPPDPEERRHFRYPELRVEWQPSRADAVHPPRLGKFQTPGIYATTVTQPGFFRPTCSSSCGRWSRNSARPSEVHVSDQEIPYPYVLDRGDELVHSGAIGRPSWRDIFPTPLLAAVGDEVADGTWTSEEGRPRPLALFDAVRVDYSLRRLVHYTGTDWRSVQPWILLTNYQRYVDQFVALGAGRAGASPTAPTTV